MPGVGLRFAVFRTHAQVWRIRGSGWAALGFTIYFSDMLSPSFTGVFDARTALIQHRQVSALDPFNFVHVTHLLSVLNTGTHTRRDQALVMQQQVSPPPNLSPTSFPIPQHFIISLNTAHYTQLSFAFIFSCLRCFLSPPSLSGVLPVFSSSLALL